MITKFIYAQKTIKRVCLKKKRQKKTKTKTKEKKTQTHTKKKTCLKYSWTSAHFDPYGHFCLTQSDSICPFWAFKPQQVHSLIAIETEKETAVKPPTTFVFYGTITPSRVCIFRPKTLIYIFRVWVVRNGGFISLNDISDSHVILWWGIDVKVFVDDFHPLAIIGSLHFHNQLIFSRRFGRSGDSMNLIETQPKIASWWDTESVDKILTVRPVIRFEINSTTFVKLTKMRPYW